MCNMFYPIATISNAGAEDPLLLQLQPIDGRHSLRVIRGCWVLMGFVRSPRLQDVTANILTMTMDSAESMTADPGGTPLEEKKKPQLMVSPKTLFRCLVLHHLESKD